MSTIEGFGRVEFPESPKTEMEVVHIPTSTGIVQDLHVIRELRGSEVHSEVIPPKKVLSRECAAAILLPPLKSIQGMVKNAQDSLSVSSSQTVNVERAEKQGQQLKRKFDTLNLKRDSLQIGLNLGDSGLKGKIEAFNKEVQDYNKQAGAFQKKFEADFLDRADAGFYDQDVIQPKGIQSCPIGDQDTCEVIIRSPQA
ncbi:MAG: hypothetical protein ACI9YB_003382 [Halioglobus sp.]|jgi:hypothetical protein